MRTNWRAAAITATAALLAGCGGGGTETNEASAVLPLTEANGAENGAAPAGAGPAPAAGTNAQAGTDSATPQPVTGAPPQPGAAPPQPTGAPPPAAPAPAPAPGGEAAPPALEQDYTTGNDQGRPPG